MLNCLFIFFSSALPILLAGVKKKQSLKPAYCRRSKRGLRKNWRVRGRLYNLNLVFRTVLCGFGKGSCADRALGINMEEKSRFCQYHRQDMEDSSLPNAHVTEFCRKVWMVLNRYVLCLRVMGPKGLGPRILADTQLTRYAPRRSILSIRDNPLVLGLQPGELVEVRSAKQIFATLDGYDKLRGLQFTPEMAKFCGGRFIVFKKVRNIILEGSGELRRIKSPTVLLEGVICDGSAHGGCDKSCFLYWREQWLKRVPQTSGLT